LEKEKKETRRIITAPNLGWMQVRNAISLSPGLQELFRKRDHVAVSRLCVYLGPLEPDDFEEFKCLFYYSFYSFEV
jgi:hypothetical protein